MKPGRFEKNLLVSEKQVTSSGLTLAGLLPGGAPAAGEKVQAVTGFVDREGGSFYQEWSALFLMEGGLGERIFYHYPRLQPMSGAAEQAQPLAAKDKGKLERIALKAQFLALPGHRSARRRARGLLPQLSAGKERARLVEHVQKQIRVRARLQSCRKRPTSWNGL